MLRDRRKEDPKMGGRLPIAGIEQSSPSVQDEKEFGSDVILQRAMRILSTSTNLST